jgi:hypothetical protein
VTHTWSSSWDYDGITHMVFTTCVEHPRTKRLQTYDWPNPKQLADHLVEHEKEVQARENVPPQPHS